MTILDEIVQHKKLEVQKNKDLISVQELEKTLLFQRETYSISAALKRSNSSGIIAEFKRKSPSKGVINNTAQINQVALKYKNGGAVAMSVLTDSLFFGGNIQDLITARNFIDIPILRKDFIVDLYQIIETKAVGADFVLLIASVLSKKQIVEFSNFAHSLGLEVLLEIHNENELIKIDSSVDLVGVNNRNLNDFSVTLETSVNLSEKIPEHFIKISESGISSKEQIDMLKSRGYQGFLIGEHFMSSSKFEL